MNKRHRVFIAINLPMEIKRSLAPYQKKWPELPARWTKPDNLHITLAFLGYLQDEELVKVCKNTKELAGRHNPFDINLFKICYGPMNKKPARMVWAVGERSEELASLNEDLDKSLGVSENREFTPHITLARIRKWEWQRIEVEDRPIINEDINLEFSVDSIEVMESALKRGGVEYEELSSYKLRISNF